MYSSGYLKSGDDDDDDEKKINFGQYLHSGQCCASMVLCNGYQ